MSTYRRFYCGATEDEQCIPHIINILAKIVDDNNLLSITKAISAMDPRNVVFAYDESYQEQWYQTLISSIRHAEKTKLAGLITPAKFRNKVDNIDMVKGVELFTFDEPNGSHIFSEHCADTMIKQWAGDEQIYAYFDIIGPLAFPQNIAAEVVLMYKKNNTLYCDLLVLKTPKGDTLRLVHQFARYSIAALGEKDSDSNISPIGLKLLGINITSAYPATNENEPIHTNED